MVRYQKTVISALDSFIVASLMGESQSEAHYLL